MLETRRLSLRNFLAEDAEVLFEYRNDIRCNLYQRYDATDKEHLQRFVSDFSRCSFLSMEEEQHYAIILTESGEMIGDVSIFFSKDDNCFTLGITISPLYQRKGYAFEILREVIARIRGRYPSVDIVALIDKENTKSVGLFEKLGFSLECYAGSIRSYVFTIYGQRC